ncbi:SIR2 family protein [Chryseobacterium sp. D764]|uniref:SIR2 family protein n=1 Tax=Chryseobacterium sp. D764 TaxID=2856522 RepID=UPI001C5913F1|nr:SIR2 family protein [Chryseobacterium sp. D764]QXU50171.1 SIR2 family protein [Chryseobacterium sp. D764]
MENEKILKIIESSHFNFLIGSGASRNYLETLGNIEDLLTSLDRDFQNNRNKYWFKVLDTSIKYWYFDKCIRGNLKLIDDKFTLSEDKQNDFIATNEIYITLLQTLNILLLKRRNKLLPKEVNIFTTNMDIFLDINLDKLGLEFNDGFNGKFNKSFNTANYQKSFYKNSSQYSIRSELPVFNLFKLHGSLTWDKSNDAEIKFDSNLIALNDLNEIRFPEQLLITLTKEVELNGKTETKLKDYNELKKEAEEKTDIEDAHENLDKFYAIYDKLVMINPTKEKFENTTLRLEYYEQIRMFSNILERENSVLFVTGFSFADEHIRQITYRALNSNPTLLIIVFNYSEGGKKQIDGFFSNLKYKNLYTDFIGFDFKKIVNEIFLSIAEHIGESNKNEKPIIIQNIINTDKTK